MDFLFLLFIFLAAVGIVGGAYFLYSGGRHITAFLFFGGLLALTVVFGLRWFRNDGSLNTPSVAAWPPVINVCPDFLSLTSIDGRAVCVDTVGVAPNGGLQQNDGTQMDAKTYFDLQADTTDAAARTAQLCDQCRSQMLTWEGVYDGASCIGGNPPYPPLQNLSAITTTETVTTTTPLEQEFDAAAAEEAVKEAA